MYRARLSHFSKEDRRSQVPPGAHSAVSVSTCVSPLTVRLSRLFADAFKRSPVPPDARNVDRPVPSPAPPRGVHGRAGSRAAGTFWHRTFSVVKASSLTVPVSVFQLAKTSSSGPRGNVFQTTEGLEGFPDVRFEGHRLVWTAVPPSGRSRRVCSAPVSGGVVLGRVFVEQEEIRASLRGGPAGQGLSPLEQGLRAGAAPGGTVCLSGQSCVQRLDRAAEMRYPGGKPLSRWPLAARHREE